jgi:hypothetical protein
MTGKKIETLFNGKHIPILVVLGPECVQDSRGKVIIIFSRDGR